MERGFRIVRVGGIEINASWSWLLVVGIVVWSLATVLFPTTYPDLDGATHVAMALVTALLFFTSILLHELGHARRAQREGVPIDEITLWLFGGVAKLRGNPPSPGAAFRVSVMGPVVTVVLAVAFGVAAVAGSELGWPDAVQGVVDYLARINVLVLAFNLVPALPLDGGRILHAWLWQRTGSFSASAVQAAAAGRWFGWMLVVVGVLGFFGGSGLGGLWIAFIGWFLVQAAQAEASHALLRSALGPARVREAMTPSPATVRSDVGVEPLLDRARRERHSTYPVVDDGDVVGLVSVSSAGELPADERAGKRVADVMTPRGELSEVSSDRRLADVLDRFGDERSRVLVMDDGQLVGLLAPSDLLRAVELGRATGDRPTEEVRRPGVGVWVVVGAVFVLAAGYLYHPPLVVLAPGEAVAIDDGIEITGVPVGEVEGDYLLVGVRLERPNALGAVVSWLRSDRELVTLGDILPAGAGVGDYFDHQRQVFEDSREIAAAAGARAAGLDVAVRGDGARVEDVLGGSPADGELESGEVIVAVEGREVATSSDLRGRLRAFEAGSDLTLTVETEGGGSREVEIETAALPEVAGGSGLGVLVTTEDLEVDLPFEITFTERDVGGPSGGLAYALAVADLLDPDDLARGRTIAATGTIAPDGQVGPVGAIDLKARTAVDAGADVFLLPESDDRDVPDVDIRVRVVRSLDAARDLLLATG